MKACADCAVWKRHTYQAATTGDCRRFPPTVVAGGQHWPVTKPDDSCGEWRQKPET
jgi:hypothetical protein